MNKAKRIKEAQASHNALEYARLFIENGFNPKDAEDSVLLQQGMADMLLEQRCEEFPELLLYEDFLRVLGSARGGNIADNTDREIVALELLGYKGIRGFGRFEDMRKPYPQEFKRAVGHVCDERLVHADAAVEAYQDKYRWRA